MSARLCEYCGDRARPLVRGIDGTKYHAGLCRILAKRDQDAARIADKRAGARLTGCIVCGREGAMVWSRLLYPVGADSYLSHEAEICGTRCCLKWQASTGQPFPDGWSRLDVTDDDVRQALIPHADDMAEMLTDWNSPAGQALMHKVMAPEQGNTGKVEKHNTVPSGQLTLAALPASVAFRY